MNFYSQHGEDKWIVENLPLPQHGTFVECGVGHSAQGSNTLHFEQQGWDGILIEPDPRTRDEIKANRRARLFTCAAGAAEGTASFGLEAEPTLSGIRRTGQHRIDVPVRTLNSIFQEAGINHVDLLSVDTEGTEIDVLAGLDVARYAPTVVIVEFHTCGLPVRPELILNAVTDSGYHLVHSTPGNFIFRRWGV